MTGRRRIKQPPEGTTKGAGANAVPTEPKLPLPPPAQSGHRRYDTPSDPVVGATPADKPLLAQNLKVALGRVSGLSHTEMEGIAVQVQDNWKRLNGCAKHAFTRDDRVPYQPMRERYVCTVCGGTIDSVAFHWWQRGMKDAHA